MRTWTRTAGILFLAASAVYNSGAVAAGMAKAGVPTPSVTPDTGTYVVPIDEPAVTAPAPAKDKAPTTKPAKAPQPAAAAPDEVAIPVEAALVTPPAGTSVSASKVNYSKDAGTVEIHVNDANLVEVLRMLSMQANTNILPSKDVRGTVTANLYDVTIKEALDAILKANGFGYREKGNVIYVYSAKEIADIDKSDRKQSTEVFHLYYTPAVNAQTMIKPVLSSEGQVAVSTPAASGIDSTSKDAGGNTHAVEDMMVVTDYPENIERVRKILKDIDKRPQQILVEATILRASLTEGNSLGIDFTLLGGVDFNKLTGAPGPTGSTAANGGLTNGSGGTGTTGYTAVNTGFTQGLPTGGLKVGFVYNNVAAFIQALEEVTNTTVMANPKVLVVNKQRGEVKVARQDPFRGKTLVNSNGLSQQEVDFLETGTLLIFRPYIGDDGYIRMEVHPEDSTPLPSRAADLPPTKLTTETTTNIMVKDGHTVVIGGLFRETAQTSKSQVPGLGNVPFLGRLFGNQQDNTQREEVIILLTPHIIKDDSAFSRLSEEQKKETEKLRVGVRQGMMPWGRERLAESSYEKAVAEMNKPNPDRQKAIWHLNCATNLNPSFSEAIDLKQKVTGREITTSDNSSIRGFVRKMMLEDRPLPVAAAAPATQPATQSSTATALAPATQPSTAQASTKDVTDPDDDDFEFVEAAKPAVTAPEAKSESKPVVTVTEIPTTVTEIPTEEIKDEPDDSDK